GYKPTTEPFNDELINELQAGSKIHTGPVMLTSGRDDVALISEKLQFAHKIPMYPSTDPGGYAYVVPADCTDGVAEGFEYARRRGQNLESSWTNLTLADWEQLQLWRSKVDENDPNPRIQQAS
ncbi:hypothetical protein E4U38_001079, partial [Claviceps purpurea]